MSKKYVIRGDSMKPFLKDGDIVSPIETDRLELGDVVIFTADDNMKVFHRVVLINRFETKCKGDNCLHFDWIRYNFGSKYLVIRQSQKESIAKLSKYWGDKYFNRYKKNPDKFQKVNLYVRLMRTLQQISMKILRLYLLLFKR